MSEECPHYYRLADGREFAEFLEADAMWEIYRYAAEHGANIPSPYTLHCLFSAMEHRFREGKKEGEERTDIRAGNWWFRQAELSYQRSYKDWEHIHGLIKTMEWIVQKERVKVIQATRSAS